MLTSCNELICQQLQTEYQKLVKVSVVHNVMKPETNKIDRGLSLRQPNINMEQRTIKNVYNKDNKSN